MKTIYDTQQLHKHAYRKKIAGVCAGLARHWGLETWLVRLGAAVGFIMFPMVVAIAYTVAALVLPSR